MFFHYTTDKRPKLKFVEFVQGCRSLCKFSMNLKGRGNGARRQGGTVPIIFCTHGV